MEETEKIEVFKTNGLPEWNPVVRIYRCNSVSNETSLTLVFV